MINIIMIGIAILISTLYTGMFWQPGFDPNYKVTPYDEKAEKKWRKERDKKRDIEIHAPCRLETFCDSDELIIRPKDVNICDLESLIAIIKNFELYKKHCKGVAEYIENKYIKCQNVK